ncbi:MAG: translation initiation factor IF-3 [Phycisphaerae bacterium]
MRMNEQIRVPKIRVISETGEQLGVIPTREAIERARSIGLDLMEVAPNENPPVCKIMDYGKYKYQQQKKEHLARKKQHVHEQKELRIRPKTDDHDIEIKLDRAREFLEEGSKVQFTMIFRGRENLHQDIGRETFKEIIVKLDDVAKIERETRSEGRRMIMILAPKVKKLPVSVKPQKKIEPPKPDQQTPGPQTQLSDPQPAGKENGSTPIQV